MRSYFSRQALYITFVLQVFQFFQPSAAVRPEYGYRPAQWSHVVPDDDSDAVEDAANRSLFQDLPAKLQPVLGRRLPLWQVEAAVIGIIVVVMLVVLIFLLKGKKAAAQSYTLPAAPAGDQEAGEGTLDQKLSLLKKQKTKILMHQVIEKQKLERILKDIMTLEAERKQEAGEIDPEAVKAKAQDTIKAVDISMSKNMTTALAYMMPMVMQSQRIYETIDKRSKKAQEMIARAAVEEVKNLTKDMQDVFEVQDIKGQIFKSLGEIDTPSLATIIASAFAPAQLRALHISNYISLMTVLVVVIIDALILVSNRGFTCQSFVGNKEGKQNAVDLWYKVDLGIAAFCVLVRLWTVRTLSPLIQEMNNPPMLEMQDDPVQALRALLAYYLNTGSRAIMRVDEITESSVYALSNWTVLFNLIWISAAGYLVLNTPWFSCHDPGLIVLRIRFIFFLILIVPVLLNVVLFFAGRLLSGEGLQISLLNSASKADESLGIGVPLCSILVQAFFIRNKRDMINIQLKILQMKKEEAEKKRLEAEKELQRLQGDETSQDSQVETLQHQLQEEAGKDENQVVKEQEEQREKVLQEAEQVFGLLNERAKKASGEAEAQVKKWEEGDGGELLQAISKGEGGAKLQEMLGQVDVQSMASQYAQQAQQMAGEFQNQEWVKDAAQRAQAAAADAQQRGQELYNSEEVQGLMQGDQLQSALQAGQEAASSAAAAAQDAMSK